MLRRRPAIGCALACRLKCPMLSETLEPIRAALTPATNEALATGREAYQQSRVSEAEAAFRSALTIEPNNPTALNGLGMCLYRQARHAEARPYFARVNALAPDVADAHFFGAACALMDQDHAAAERGYRAALALNPNDARYVHGLATLRSVSGDVEAALAGFQQAQRLLPGYHWAQFSEGLTLLGMGRWIEGWPLIEARHAIGVTQTPLEDRPRWDGRPLAGGSILLRTEQGIGDALHMVRYVHNVREAGAGRIVLQARPELFRLFRHVGADLTVLLGDELPATDCYADLMSLPGIFAATPADTWGGVYVAPRAQDTLSWRRRLAGQRRPRVGLCWAGGEVPWAEPSALAVNARRSLTAAALGPLLAVPGATFVSLQLGQPAPPGVWSRTDELVDMADTAALIAACDLVITVDTSIVHLAGAMGWPVWMLDRLDKCWRWLPGQEYSPWYPTLRIFRQSRLGDWVPVIERAAVELSHWTRDVAAVLRAVGE